MRFVVLIPLVLSIVGFVLSILMLFAGSNEGFMEDYDIIRINMTGFGKDLVLDLAGDDTSPDNSNSGGGGIGGFIGDIIDDISNEFTGVVNNITNEVVGKALDKIGLPEWYSMHVMGFCQGSYEPEAAALNPSLNVTNCTDPSHGYQINLTALIDHDLQVGPLHLSATDLPIPSGIEDQVSKINAVTSANFALYCVAAGLSGLAILGAAASFCLPDSGKLLPTLVNTVLTFLAAIILICISLLTTVGIGLAADKITELGEDFGITAQRGNRFIVVTWVAFAVMFLAFVFWIVDSVLVKRRRRRAAPNVTREK